MGIGEGLRSWFTRPSKEEDGFIDLAKKPKVEGEKRARGGDLASDIRGLDRIHQVGAQHYDRGEYLEEDGFNSDGSKKDSAEVEDPFVETGEILKPAPDYLDEDELIEALDADRSFIHGKVEDDEHDSGFVTGPDVPDETLNKYHPDIPYAPRGITKEWKVRVGGSDNSEPANENQEEFLQPVSDNEESVRIRESRKELQTLKAYEAARAEYRKLREREKELKAIKTDDDPDLKKIIGGRLAEIEMLIRNRFKKWEDDQDWGSEKGEFVDTGILRDKETKNKISRLRKKRSENEWKLGEKKERDKLKRFRGGRAKAFSDDLAEAEKEKMADHELAGFKGRVKARMPKIGSTKSELAFKARNEKVLENIGSHQGMKHGLYSVDDGADRARIDHTKDYKGPAYAKHKRGAINDRRDSIRGGVEDLSVPLMNKEQYGGSQLLPDNDLLHFRDEVINSQDSEKVGENFDKLRKALAENPEQNELVRRIVETVNKFASERSQELWDQGIIDLVDAENPEKAKASFLRFLVSEGGITSVYHPDFYKNKKIRKFDLDLVLADAVLKFSESIFANTPGAENLARDLATRLGIVRRDYLYGEEKVA